MRLLTKETDKFNKIFNIVSSLFYEKQEQLNNVKRAKFKKFPGNWQ